ncbi:MAG: histidine phosphatase family protein [Helicobacteraceae bacterium]|jgi:phosphohistidine phosphatase|nr:histidine phosphatase family protein [Helicobacteraceae bacterium]
MKTLVLMRHAKAAKPLTKANDRERGLTMDGRVQAEEIARALANENFKPDAILVSDAKRARETALIVADILGVFDRVKTAEKLYDGGAREYIRAIDAIASRVESALVIGHNPSISDAGALICDDFTEQFAPADALGIELDRTIGEGTGKRLFFLNAAAFGALAS